MNSIIQKIKNSEYFTIAEIGLNHDGSLGNSFRLIEEAKKAGVNAIKFQLHISKEERTDEDLTPAHFKLEDREEYYERTSFTLKEWKKLEKYTHDNDLFFIVSPFTHAAVDILEELDIDAYKIAAGETTNIPLLEYINSKNKPILLSTGMSDWLDIENAVEAIRYNLIVIFQCSSDYPCEADNVGLNVITEMIDKYKEVIIGYSDHTLKYYAAIAAYMTGARVFEKHFTLSKILYSPDAKISVNPTEMAEYVRALEFVSRILENPVDKDSIERYNSMKHRFEKSIVASRNLNKGDPLKFEDLAFKKPGNGIRADKYKEIIGKRLNRNIKKDEKILFKDLI